MTSNEVKKLMDYLKSKDFETTNYDGLVAMNLGHYLKQSRGKCSITYHTSTQYSNVFNESGINMKEIEYYVTYHNDALEPDSVIDLVNARHSLSYNYDYMIDLLQKVGY